MTGTLAHNAILLCEIGLLACAVSLLVRIVRRRRDLPLPPGPPGLPIVGNILLMNPDKGWEEFEQWSKIYDCDLISLGGLGQRMIVANTYSSAKAILERLNMSDRPRSMSMGELAGWKRTTVMHPYDDVWKLQRRYLHQTLGSRAGLRKYDELREAAAARFVKGLLDDTQSLEEQCHIFTSDVMLRIAYGYKSVGHDPMIQMAEKALQSSSEFTSPGTWLVDVLPILQYVPAWVPGSRLRSAVETERQNMHTLFDIPFEWVKTEIAKGKVSQSFTGELLSQLDMTPEGEMERGHLPVNQTTWTVYAFFKLMCSHRDVQERAQAEIDNVVGPDRLPAVSDMAMLPYTYACCLEILRYHIVAPFGLPHRAAAADTYGGCHIPAGATVFPNAWAISRDENEYPQPHVFNPARFVGEKQQRNPHDWAFGFGRRICPGRILADESIFIACATALATMDFAPKMRNGRPVPIDLSQMAGLVSLPTPFEYEAKARSERARALIDDAVMAH
ncbi:cytochrome P450 [Schizophyllum fasciatum]